MRVLIAGLDEDTARQMFGALEGMVEQGGILHDWTRLLSAVEHAEPDVVVLYLGSRPGQTLSMARRVLSSHPSLRIVALADTNEPELVKAVTRAGCCADLALLSEGPEDLRRAFELMNEREVAPTADGKAYAVLGAKGGVGTTIVAVNLAAEIYSRTKSRVIVVDLNLYLGDVAFTLDITPDPTALWFLLRGSNADPETWAEGPPTHRAGFRVLGLDGDLEQIEPVTAEQVVNMVDRLRERHDHVIIDLGSDLNEISLAACTATDKRLIVLTEELPALLGAKRRVEALRSLELGDGLASLILNRVGGQKPADLQTVEDATGVPISGLLSNAWKEVHGALENGRVLREAWPRAQITKDFQDLATVVLEEGGKAQRKRKFFEMFGNR